MFLYAFFCRHHQSIVHEMCVHNVNFKLELNQQKTSDLDKIFHMPPHADTPALVVLCHPSSQARRTQSQVLMLTHRIAAAARWQSDRDNIYFKLQMDKRYICIGKYITKKNVCVMSHTRILIYKEQISSVYSGLRGVFFLQICYLNIKQQFAK